MTVQACMQGLPKTLKIGPYDWTIVLMDEDGDPPLCGQADFAVHHLRLWPKNLNSPSHAVATTLHEAYHVVFENGRLGKLKRGSEDREEQIVEAFEAGTISLLRDNPRFLNWVRKWLK